MEVAAVPEEGLVEILAPKGSDKPLDERMRARHDGPSPPGLGKWWFARIRRTTSLSISRPKAYDCWAMRGQPKRGLRRLISRTAAISSFDGPLGPGRLPVFAENSH